MATQAGDDKTPASSRKRTRIPRPYPVHALEDALAIATAIQEKNSGLPFDRVLLAKAMGTTPASSGFTTKLNSSAKYGLTQGGYTDDRIALTERGASIVAPDAPDQRRAALLNAALEPDVFRGFYRMLDGKRLPEDAYSQKVLERDLGVQSGLTDECLSIIVANGRAAGVLGDVGGSMYVSLAGAHTDEPSGSGALSGASENGPPAEAVEQLTPSVPAAGPEARTDPGPATKVFVGHAGNSDIVEHLKAVLDPFGIPYVVVDSDYDATRPLAAEVTDRMRECLAAILVFAPATDAQWKGRREDKRAQKMMYLLGAASALYGDRLIAFTETSSGGPQEHALHALEFHRDRPGEMGLALLTQLHRLGVIHVSV